MALLVVSHLAAGGLSLALGLLLSGLSPASARRRSALRWAFERARSDAERAREREAAARAELAAALEREGAARSEAEQSKALAVVLEAEMVAARWEKEELVQQARLDGQEADDGQAVAALEAALRTPSRPPPDGVVGWQASARESNVVQLVRFSAVPRSAPWTGAVPAACVRGAPLADG